MGGIFDMPGRDEKCILNFSRKSKAEHSLGEVNMRNGS
jgi:hypothetical protein